MMELKYNKTKVKTFTKGFFIIWAVLAGVFYFKGSIALLLLFASGFIYSVISFAACIKLMYPVYFMFTLFGIVINRFITYFILTFIFIVATTPISLLLRFTGKDILDLKIDKNKKSYWKDKKTIRDIKKYYEKQF